MDFILWIIAVIFVVAGIWQLFLRAWIWGILLIVIGLLIGPGGISLLS